VSAQVLIAFDKFKGSISAVEATSIFTAELLALDESLEIVQSPISDGGGGALEIIANYGYHLVEVSTVDALLRPRKAHYALSNDGDTAFIEMASICGIAELNQLNPFSASSFGLGEVARTAINSGAKNLIISLGGSASTDGGLGFLSGIGGKALDANGVQVSPNLYGLESVVEIHVDKVLKNIVWKFLIDVDNPLVGKMELRLCLESKKA
jgi:glycerate kinase